MPYQREIVLVDDDDLVRRVLQDILEAFGYRCFAFENAAGALALLTTRWVDLVVTDLVMPEMDGVSFALVVKERYPQLPILAITGSSNGLAVPPGLFRRVWQKPISPIVLLKQAVEECLARSP